MHLPRQHYEKEVFLEIFTLDRFLPSASDAVDPDGFLLKGAIRGLVAPRDAAIVVDDVVTLSRLLFPVRFLRNMVSFGLEFLRSWTGLLENGLKI